MGYIFLWILKRRKRPSPSSRSHFKCYIYIYDIPPQNSCISLTKKGQKWRLLIQKVNYWGLFLCLLCSSSPMGEPSTQTMSWSEPLILEAGSLLKAGWNLLSLIPSQTKISWFVFKCSHSTRSELCFPCKFTFVWLVQKQSKLIHC